MTKIEINREEVEATKLAVRRMDVHTISSRNVVIKCIRLLLDLYQKDPKEEYVRAAIARLQAYLELGFCYEDERELFDSILEIVGTSKIEQFPRRSYAAKRILATRAQVGGVIKRWNGAGNQTMTKDRLIEDILDKVVNQKTGVYEYHSAANTKKTSKDNVYILFIDEEEQTLYDVERDIFYTFTEG